MRKLDFIAEPRRLTDFKRSHPNGRYDDIDHRIRGDIRLNCTQAQHYLCAYCCQPISGEKNDTHNEHLKSRSTTPQNSLDVTNIVACCNTPKQCGDAHQAQTLPLTPYMPECETELQFHLNGCVTGTTERAKQTIAILNLGESIQQNPSLVEKRKQLIEALIFTTYGGHPSELTLESDPAFIQLLITEISTPQNGKLPAFAPILTNLLQQYITWLR